MLISDAPKYGNDDDYVDQLIVDAYDVYINEVKKYPNTRYGRGPIGGTRYPVPPVSLPMSVRERELLLLRTGVMLPHRLLKAVPHHMVWIRTDLLLYSKPFPSFRHMKLPAGCC